jgi:hypothetical protein
VSIHPAKLSGAALKELQRLGDDRKPAACACAERLRTWYPLSDDTEVSYLHWHRYEPGSESAIRWNDPQVSNHGGRQLDGVASTISMMPRIADKVGGKTVLLMDGGVRSGHDI